MNKNNILVVIGALMILALLTGLKPITGNVISNVTDDNGTGTFSVDTNIIINITDDTIALGSIALGESKASEDVADYFTVENLGSIDVDLYAYGIASPFTSTLANSLPTSYFKIRTATVQGAATNELASYTAVPANVGTKVLLISDMEYEQATDSATIGINVTVPIDETAGAKSATITLLATATV